MTNKNKTTLYVGVTSDLLSRVLEHKEGIYKNSFTQRYNLHFLVYQEWYSTIEEAIEREKQLKKYSRVKKDALINKVNPGWTDQFTSLTE